MQSGVIGTLALLSVLALPLSSLDAQQGLRSVEGVAVRSTPLAASAPTSVPALVPYSGFIVGADGKALSSEVSATFLIYKDETGGQPLFTETQMIAPDAGGRYEVQLGATLSNGIPLDLFGSGEARWLEVQIAEAKTQQRTLLASVPYAMKAGDATTLGGLPASAYALAGSAAALQTVLGNPNVTSNAVTTVTTTGGTSGQLPLFSGASTIVNSMIYQTTAGIGINRVPAATLDVNGTVFLRGDNTITVASAPTATKGAVSHALRFTGGAYNSSSKAVVEPYFQLQSEPSGNNTASPAATFNLLYNTGTASAPTETGFYINPNGTIHFAAAQTFPTGSGAGTITGVTAGTGLTGGGTSGKVTLNVNTAAIPTLTGSNNFTGTETFTASINENNDINIDNLNKNTGNVSPGIRFGNASGEGISSQRTSSGNSSQYGLDFYTDYSRRLSILPGGDVEIGDLAALSGPGSTTLYLLPSQSDSDVFYTAGQGGSCDIDTDGDLACAGSIYGASKNFKIDDPMDPANKYLVHASVESSEMLNLYSGNVTTDGSGSATVTLPEWFASENGDFRYQLTTIGQDAHAWISQEVSNRVFKVATNAANIKVSWQITATRQDGYAKANPLVVEQEKVGKEHGFYQHPEFFGQPKEKSISWARRLKKTSEAKAPLGVAKLSIDGGSIK